jgi:hypothetical protein
MLSSYFQENYLSKFILFKQTLWLLVRKRTLPTEWSPLEVEVSAKFLLLDGCLVVSATDPYGRYLGFLDRSCYFFKYLIYPHEAEWTPFQTSYFSVNLIAP